MSFLAEKVIVMLGGAAPAIAGRLPSVIAWVGGEAIDQVDVPDLGPPSMSGDGDLLRPWAPIDLARESEFALGSARVRPSFSEMLVGDDAIRLQPQVMKVLVALHQARGEVISRDELIARCWGGLTVGEDSITRCIAALRRLSENEAAGVFAVETLPRIGYRLTDLVEAGVETTPEISERSTEPVVSRRRGFPVWLTAGAVALLALAGGGIWLFGMLRPAQADIAIAPLAVAAGDADARTVSAALPDMLASLYAKADVKSLTLPAATGSANARFLIRGEVEDAGQALNATVVVTDPAREEVLWSSDFSRPRNQIRALEHQIAARTAAVSWCAIDLVKRAPRNAGGDLIKAAFAACNRDLNDRASMDSGDRARVAMANIVARYPDFAPGLAIMADLDSGLAGRQPPEAAAVTRAAGRALAVRALKLDPHEGRAWYALANLLGASPPPLALYRLTARGFEGNPNDGFLNIEMGDVMGIAGYNREAIGYGIRARALRSLDPSMAAGLATAFANADQIGDARQVVDDGLTEWPDEGELMVTAMATETREGDPDRALSLASRTNESGIPWYAPNFAERMRRIAMVRKAPTPAAIAAAAKAILADYRGNESNGGQALLDLVTIGAVDQAYALAATLKATDIDTSAFFRPAGAAVRADKRFMPLAARLGLVALWRARGRWPDFCQAPGAPYDCAKAAAGF